VREDGVDTAAHLGPDAGLLGAEVEEGHRRADGRRGGGALLLSQAHPSLVWFRGGFRKFGARGAGFGAVSRRAVADEGFLLLFAKRSAFFLGFLSQRREAVLFLKPWPNAKEPKNVQLMPVRGHRE
jgi:hypothetical protein